MLRHKFWHNRSLGNGFFCFFCFFRCFGLNQRVLIPLTRVEVIGCLVIRTDHDLVGKLQRLQFGKNSGIGFFQKAGSKLMQKPSNILSCFLEHTALRLGSTALFMHPLQSMLQRPRHIRQRQEANSGRTASERMRERFSVSGHMPVHLERPLGQQRQQAARPFIGFVQIHVVKRNANTQRADQLDLLIVHYAALGQLQQGVRRRWNRLLSGFAGNDRTGHCVCLGSRLRLGFGYCLCLCLCLVDPHIRLRDVGKDVQIEVRHFDNFNSVRFGSRERHDERRVKDCWQFNFIDTRNGRQRHVFWRAFEFDRIDQA